MRDLLIHQPIKQLKLIELLWDFDCVSLFSSALWDKASKYLRTETDYVFTPDMDDELVEKFSTQTFTQGSAILKIKYYNPKDLIVQHLTLKEKKEKWN